MLRSIGKPSLLLKLGARRCVFLPIRYMDEALRSRIRPMIIGRYAMWCDKPDAS